MRREGHPRQNRLAGNLSIPSVWDFCLRQLGVCGFLGFIAFASVGLGVLLREDLSFGYWFIRICTLVRRLKSSYF